ncbi:hypothetical protein [Corticicoccus populi]|uniref:Uncharacterized protein n=1 Tax=Corticicoccus populi TaxID=1812821 RepID=A0ABW5WR07_9STAP
MKYSIGKLLYFNELGFNTEHWRKSLNGEYAVVHYDTVKFVVDKDRLELYNHNSEEFIRLMNSSEWSEENK